MTYRPMLVRDGDPAALDDLIADENIAFQRKLDGHRRPVVIDIDGVTRGLNRDGDSSTLPPQVIADLGELRSVILDCELILATRSIQVFDLVEFGSIITPALPLHKRLDALEWLFEHHEFGPSVERVPYAKTAEDKRALIAQVDADGGEGWVAKPLDGAYRFVPKGRSPWLRFKRRATIDCVVMARGRDRDHLVVGLYNPEGVLVPIGTVTAGAGDGPKAQKDDVVEVKLMGITPGGRMREPTDPRIRTDGKTARQCTTDQMDSIRLTTRSAHVT